MKEEGLAVWFVCAMLFPLLFYLFFYRFGFFRGFIIFLLYIILQRFVNNFDLGIIFTLNLGLCSVKVCRVLWCPFLSSFQNFPSGE